MALIATIDDPFVRTLIDERDSACATIGRLSVEAELLANEVDCLYTLIKNINAVYINMDLPGLMSWDERIRLRVEIVNDVNMLMREMERENL